MPRYLCEGPEKLQRLQRLLKLGALRDGYSKQLQRIRVAGTTYSFGATGRLRALFYNNHSPAKQFRARSSSSRTRGDALHRHIYHVYVCRSGRRACACRDRFGVLTAAPREKSATHKQLKQLQHFIRSKGWLVLDCETAVGWAEARTATMIDALCYAPATGDIFVLEFKTGYANRHRSSTALPQLDSGQMEGRAGRYLACSAYNQHHLQLWFGIRAFAETYARQPSDGLLIYFERSPRADTYRLSVHYHRKWLERVAVTEEALAAQLLE